MTLVTEQVLGEGPCPLVPLILCIGGAKTWGPTAFLPVKASSLLKPNCTSNKVELHFYSIGSKGWV